MSKHGISTNLGIPMSAMVKWAKKPSVNAKNLNKALNNFEKAVKAAHNAAKRLPMRPTMKNVKPFNTAVRNVLKARTAFNRAANGKK